MEKKFPRGTDLARFLGSKEHADVIDAFKEQLLIVFLKRLVDKDGRFTVSVAEVDDTYQDMLYLAVRDGIFYFELRKKD